MVERVVTIPWDRPPADVEFRAINDAGPGPASAPVRAQAAVGTSERQIYLNGEWVTVDEYVVATAVEALRSRARHSESDSEVTAESITDLTVQIGRRAAASALQALQLRVIENEGSLSSQALEITQLMADIAGAATTQALQQLIARVVQTETGVSANAAEIVALEAAHGGRTLGPVQNIFSGDDKAAAADARDTYATANQLWLADYDADNDINIELRWGVLYIYQRRVNGAWLDNGEALARAAAVTDLNTQVVQQGTSLTSVSEMVTALMASIGTLTATAFQELSARVTQTENVDGTTMLAQLARWLVKLQVGDLVGGVGLYNDGNTTRFVVAADSFIVLPPGSQDDDDGRVPFAISDGQVFLDSAVVRDASIGTAKIGDAFLTNFAARHGFIQFARIAKGDIFDLTINNIIQSVNYNPGVAGWAVLRDGSFEVNGGTFRSTIQSANFLQGSAGWIIRRDGSAEFDAASIRGTLSAAHIDSDVLNSVVLHSTRTVFGNSEVVRTFNLADNWANYEVLQFYIDTIGYGYEAQPGNQIAWVRTSDLSSAWTTFSFVRIDDSTDIRTVNANTIQIRLGIAGFNSNFIVGIKELSAFPITPDPPPPPPGTTTVSANAGSNVSVQSGGSTQIGGVDTVQNGEGATTIAWSRVSGVGGSLSSTTVASPTFNAPTVTSDRAIVWRKTVMNNGVSDTDDITVTVTVGGLPATFTIEVEGPTAVDAGMAFFFVINGSDGTPPYTYSALWTRPNGTTFVSAYINAVNNNVSNITSGTWTIEITGTDANGATGTYTYTITVT